MSPGSVVPAAAAPPSRGGFHVSAGCGASVARGSIHSASSGLAAQRVVDAALLGWPAAHDGEIGLGDPPPAKAAGKRVPCRGRARRRARPRCRGSSSWMGKTGWPIWSRSSCTANCVSPVEHRPMDEQARRFVDDDDRPVAMEDVEHGGAISRRRSRRRRQTSDRPRARSGWFRGGGNGARRRGSGRRNSDDGVRLVLLFVPLHFEPQPAHGRVVEGFRAGIRARCPAGSREARVRRAL